MHNLADAGVKTLELFILGGDRGHGGFGGEVPHETRQQAVYRPYYLGIRTRHARGYTALQRLEVG